MASDDPDAWLFRHPRFAISAFAILAFGNVALAALADDTLSLTLKLVTGLGFAALLLRFVRKLRSSVD